MDLDQPKQRLTSKAQIAKVVLKLIDRGVPADKLLPTLVRRFYVDLDAFNEVIRRSAALTDNRSLDSSVTTDHRAG